MRTIRASVPEDCPWVFPGDVEGQPLIDIKRFWDDVRQSAKLPGVRIHDLRHTFASLLALNLFGTMEKPGRANNPTIVAWAQEIGGEAADVYEADSIPWCWLFMAVVAKRADKQAPAHPLWALSWSAFGAKPDAPALGDVLVFTRSGGGHVGLYVGEDGSAFHVLGGNQSDRVCITRVAKCRSEREQQRSPTDVVREIPHQEQHGEGAADVERKNQAQHDA